MLARRQAGDTLVEVALAMAILGAVIAVAYGISNRAVRLGLEAKERNEAAQLQQYQAEALRNYRDNYGWADFHTKVNTLKMVPGEYDEADPCGDDASSNVSNRFYFSTTGGSAPKWTITKGIRPNPNDPFTQCIVARPVPDSPTPDKYRFDIHITWEPIGSGPQNRSVLTTYLGNIAEIVPE